MDQVIKNTFGLRRRLMQVAVVLLAAFLHAGCADDSPAGLVDQGPDAGYITIQLKSSEIHGRASEVGDDVLNENLMNSAIILLQPLSATENDVPAVMERVEIGRNSNATVKIRFSQSLIRTLFPEGTDECRVYAVVNLPASSTVPAQCTIDALRHMVVEADFADMAAQPCFVMDGLSTAVIARNPAALSQSTITGTVDMQRVAAKIKLAVSVKDRVTSDDGTVWTPLVSGMSAVIANGVLRTTVTSSMHMVTDADYYSTSTGAVDATHRERMLAEGNDTRFPYELKVPFYSYPHSWSGDDESMTYITLMVPWKKEDEGSESYRTSYYMVPVMRDGEAIERNVSYSVNVNVSVLGSFAPDEPFELIDMSYRVMDWSLEPLDMSIQDNRYLVLDQTEFVMNNEEHINIPFYSSHNTVVKPGSVKVKYYRYNTSAAGLEKEITITDDENNNTKDKNSGKGIYDYTVDNNIHPYRRTRTLTFDHELKTWTAYNSSGNLVDLNSGNISESNISRLINSISYYLPTDGVAYSRYEIELVLIHDDLQDDESTPFQQTVKIIQYPQMYIETEQNYHSSESVDVAEYGNMYVNLNNTDRGGTSSSGSSRNWYMAYGLGGGAGNKNPNQYVISVTHFGESSAYIIGDPRVSAIDNLGTFNGTASRYGWASAPGYESAVGGVIPDNAVRRKLSYYYPSDISSQKRNWIAPKIRIASSYGVTYPLDYSYAQKRCAAYQELGYPAGRWRIPTVGEIEFIIGLSNDRKIPALFTSGIQYWSAQGRITATLTNGKITGNISIDSRYTAAVRCVYDEWYWESSELKTDNTQVVNGTRIPKYPFTWGDRER